MPLGEDAPLEPVSPYGAAKAAMELLCGQYARSRGLRIGVARAFNLVGPGQPPFNAASGLARQIARAELDGEASVRLALGNPDAHRDLIDVRDAARALIEISRRRLEGTFNLCSGRAVSVAGLAAELGAATPLDVGTRLDPDLGRPADPPLLLGDPGRLREASGFAAETPLSQSLVDLLDWWRLRLAAP
jgi:GDP-4-dehydro-6-deoxy-D-mannose reductase